MFIQKLRDIGVDTVFIKPTSTKDLSNLFFYSSFSFGSDWKPKYWCLFVKLANNVWFFLVFLFPILLILCLCSIMKYAEIQEMSWFCFKLPKNLNSNNSGVIRLWWESNFAECRMSRKQKCLSTNFWWKLSLEKVMGQTFIEALKCL